MTLLRRFTPVVHKIDHALGRMTPDRDVLVELRTPVYHAVLSPIADALGGEPHVRVWYTSEDPERLQPLVPAGRFLTHAQVEWKRFDLYVNGDPWAAARLRRCAHRVNFFHGVAGKYDLDSPKGLPLGFEYYDYVAFINRDRMLRYLAADIIRPEQAVLVGYPKLDRLVNGTYEMAAVRSTLGLTGTRRTALYAPTYSPASSLHLSGESIVRTLVAAGFDVLVKLHDRSLDRDPRYNAGIDWRARFGELAGALGRERVRFIETPDASPLLAAADLMVTDHSSVGFEYLVLDRPLIVYDAPDLARTARINAQKVALLRSAATVVSNAGELAAAARAAFDDPHHRSATRRRVAREMFYEPGTATERAMAVLRQLLHPSGAKAWIEQPS